MSIQLRATWHIDTLDMVVLPSTGASRYNNCCIDGGINSEYFGYTLACLMVLVIHLTAAVHLQIQINLRYIKIQLVPESKYTN
jgi:hypothetical protein